MFWRVPLGQEHLDRSASSYALERGAFRYCCRLSVPTAENEMMIIGRLRTGLSVLYWFVIIAGGACFRDASSRCFD